jgi:hypothetical protein
LYPARHFGSYARAADPRAGLVSQRHPFFLRILRDTAQVAGAAASYRYGVAGGLLVAMIIDRAMGKGMATDRLVYFFLFLRRIGWFTGGAARFPVVRVASIAYPFASLLHPLVGCAPRGVGWA